jgi:uncharacterized membrane protein YhfC
VQTDISKGVEEHFFWFAVFGALGAAFLVVCTRVAADYFLMQWKFGNAGSFSLVVGYGFHGLNLIFALPGKLLSSNFETSSAQFACLVAAFSMWGVVFAFVAQRLARRPRSERY